eukprot:gnl/MRDRNA2_/MRDRNA2_28897_c0_seq1.p1 gnl/MRDRNA2_/MRDRNA2_28897_c0~~gnl/MRDRNA2_/MRDRNA2_28897_c0_seq1.p1  ORF type:complete len:1753 (+),score=324.55 gnl/MRDRNA2_/MRDRNA2_28897_c0_seq1:228-5486(+)
MSAGVNHQGEITILTPGALEEHVGIDWAKRKHRHLSFANPVFNLESLEGPDGGLMHPEMNVRLLESLDVSDNTLMEIDCIQVERGFENLRILKARRNAITEAVLHLPTLLELNLSWNNLGQMPVLKGLKNLETLILAHNKIQGNWSIVYQCPRLKRLDLADNLFQLRPSEVEEGLKTLQKLTGLTSLRLKDNPFARFFSEYQIFCIQILPSLLKLDDGPITAEVRDEASRSAHVLQALSRYDPIYNERKKQYEAKVAGRPVPLGFIPTIQDLNNLLQEVIREPVNAAVHMDHFLSMAGTLHQASPGEQATLFHQCQKASQPQEEMTAQVELLMQNMTLVLDRHDSARLLCIRSIAKLCAVATGGVGDRCMAMLGQLLCAGGDVQREVIESVEEIIVPLMQERKLTDPTVLVIMRGLSNIAKDENLLEPLGKCLKTMMKRISGWFIEVTINPPGGPSVLSLLAVATNLEHNAKIAEECQLVDTVTITLDNRQLVQNETLRGMYLDLLIIARNLARLGKHVVEAFANTGLHVKLIAQLKGFLNDDLTRMNVVELRTCSHLIDAITEMMKFSDDVLKESLLSYKLLGLVMRAPKAHVADPMLLAASLKAVRVVIENEEMREEYLRDIVEDLGRMTPLLPYLGNKKYDQCYNLAERHRKDYNPKTAVEGEAPALKSCTNRLVHHAFIAIIEMIEFFTAMTEDPQCTLVSETLNDQGRETALFTLLDVPSDDVKVAVMKCIEKVQLNQLDSEEIGFLIKLLNDSKNIGAGRTEELLESVIGQLERLVLDHTSPAGEFFMSDHSEVSIHEIFNILARNEERQTYGDLQEEGQKTTLSLACISFLRTCGRLVELRRFLRNPQAKQHLTEILKNEDELHTPTNPDIIIDRSITGTSVETLLQSFGGVDRLNPKRKVAFRATQRIADVLEGRTDLLDGTTDLTSYTFSKREALMWDDVKSKKHLKYLDDDEWNERAFQQTSFIACAGFDRLLMYLDGAFDSMVSKEGAHAKHMDDEETALRFQYEMDSMAAHIVEEMDKADQAAKDKEEPDELLIADLEGPTKSSMGSPDKNIARERLMGAMQALSKAPSKETIALFLPLNPDFEINEELFLDEEEGLVGPAFIVAATLRCAHVLLSRPVSNRVRTEMIEYLKRAETMRKLLMLIPVTGYLNCNVSAKFLKVMSQVLTLPPDQTQESISSLLLFDMLSTFIKRLCVPALQVMKQTTERPLNIHEQVLCTEISRTVEIIGRNIPYIIFSGERAEPQELCVMRCLERFISTTVVSAITQMIMYDLQVDSGSSSGDTINADFARGSMARKGMRETCSRVLAQHLQHCAPMKYAVLEAFTQAVTFGKQAIRSSYMVELLAMLNLGRYAVGVEELLQEIHDRGPNNPERVLRLFEVEICTTGARMFRTLIITNLNLYIMDKPSSAMHCGVCPPERFCPHKPVIERTCPYVDVCRLIKGYGSQLLTIGWIQPDGSEGFEHIVCHKSAERDILCEMIHTLTAQSKHADLRDCSQVCSDAMTRLIIKEAVGVDDDIFALTYAVRQDKDRLSLFVLTSQNIYEFQVNFDSYGYDPDLPASADAEDEIGPQIEMDENEKMLNELGHGVDSSQRESKLNGGDDDAHLGGKQKSDAVATKLKAIRERRKEAMRKSEAARLDACNRGTFGDLGLSHQEKRDAFFKKTKENYLKPIVEQPVSAITMIGFMPGDTPVLRLDVGETMIISFFDDMARENWRRALACALNQAEGGPAWARQYANEGEL